MVIQTNLGDFYRNYIKLNRYIRKVGVTASFMLTLMSILAIFPIVPKTNLAEAAAGAAKASETTLSMTMGSEHASLDLSPSNVDGTFAASKEDELAKFGITTDNYTGYTLSISANNDDGVLTNTDATITSNNTLSTITSVTDTTTFTDSTVFNGKWGYKPSKYNSTVNTSNFYPAPTTTSSTLDVTANPNNESNNYTIGLGARADYTKPAGTYTSTFTLTAVGNPVPYTITYADNSGDSTVANLPAPSSDLTRNTSILITSAAPTRTGYALKSWCLGTVSDSGTVCTGTEYLPGASFGIDQTTTNDTTLYAVWTPLRYDVTLTNSDATTSGSTVAYVTQDSSSVYAGTAASAGTSAITAPQRSYTFSGFAKTSSANGATVSSTSTVTYSYTFDGWYTAASGGYKVINADGTLVANAPNGTGTMTNVSSQWVSNSGTTLYAHWVAGANKTLPTIVDSSSQTYGLSNNCYWSTSASASGAKAFDSGATISSPTQNYGLNGVCKHAVNVQVTANTGVTKVEIRQGSASGTLLGTATPSTSATIEGVSGVNYYLVPTYSSNYGLSSWTQLSIYGTLSSTTAATPFVTVDSAIRGPISVKITGKKTCQDLDGTTLMQDFDASKLCDTSATSGSLKDSRDNQIYTVALIGTQWWMTRNLAIGCNGSGSTYGSSVSSKSLSSALSNVSTTWSTPTALLSNASSSTQTADYTDPRMQCNSTYGAWYNYAAATAGTITGSSNATTATYDICPKGWRLPTSSDKAAITNYYISVFNPVTGGWYDNGSNTYSNGGWWTAQAKDSTHRYNISYYDNNLNNGASNLRTAGHYVRCAKI